MECPSQPWVPFVLPASIGHRAAMHGAAQAPLSAQTRPGLQLLQCCVLANSRPLLKNQSTMYGAEQAPTSAPTIPGLQLLRRCVLTSGQGVFDQPVERAWSRVHRGLLSPLLGCANRVHAPFPLAPALGALAAYALLVALSPCACGACSARAWITPCSSMLQVH